MSSMAASDDHDRQPASAQVLATVNEIERIRAEAAEAEEAAKNRILTVLADRLEDPDFDPAERARLLSVMYWDSDIPVQQWRSRFGLGLHEVSQVAPSLTVGNCDDCDQPVRVPSRHAHAKFKSATRKAGAMLCKSCAAARQQQERAAQAAEYRNSPEYAAEVARRRAAQKAQSEIAEMKPEHVRSHPHWPITARWDWWTPFSGGHPKVRSCRFCGDDDNLALGGLFCPQGVHPLQAVGRDMLIRTCSDCTDRADGWVDVSPDRLPPFRDDGYTVVWIDDAGHVHHRDRY